MKKIILTITAVAISAVVLAQTDSINKMDQNNNVKAGHDINTTSIDDMNRQTMDNSKYDGYRMQNGKIMMSKNGQMTTMEKEMTFNDGSVLSNDGTIIRKDGTKIMIKDGEYVDFTGKIVRSDRKKDMYLVPDSSKNKK
ncbi:MAG: DUF6799 domain-containing protein [Bacteroidia bacterium]